MERSIRRQEEMRRGRTETFVFMIVTVCLVLISAFCITGTVHSQSRASERELENYFREKEQEMVREVREYLNQSGYENSGVTLNRVLETDGSRAYTLTVHHRRIDNLDEECRENLQAQLSAFDFVAENCTFFHEFLITD